MLSVNAISAPSTFDGATLNPFIDYQPDAVVKTNSAIAAYVPIISQASPSELADHVASAVIGPETAYIPTPLLPETVDHKTADLIRRGLRHQTVTHTVAQGETLGQIANEYGISLATVLHDNKIAPSEATRVKPGVTLSIAPESSSDAVAWLDKIQVVELKARQKAEQERLAKLAQSTKSRQKKIFSAASADGNSSVSGKFMRPIIGAKTCYNGYHSWAIDCPADTGSPIIAGAGGVVRVADGSGYNGGYGKTVVIDHGNGWETRYAHLNSVSVSGGERVSSGEEIGKSGNTGNSTGPHLHFETHLNGSRINPINLIR